MPSFSSSEMFSWMRGSIDCSYRSIGACHCIRSTSSKYIFTRLCQSTSQTRETSNPRAKPYINSHGCHPLPLRSLRDFTGGIIIRIAQAIVGLVSVRFEAFAASGVFGSVFLVHPRNQIRYDPHQLELRLYSKRGYFSAKPNCKMSAYCQHLRSL